MTDTFYDALSGAPATAAERRAALAELIAEGFVLGGFDVLAGLVAACPHAGTDASRIAAEVLLASDPDLLAETLVRQLWPERRGNEP